MSEADFKNFKRRIDRLEKESRLHRAGWLALLVAVSLLACVSQRQPGVIKAREFMVVDDTGKKRASLSESEHIGGRLFLYQDDGHAVLLPWSLGFFGPREKDPSEASEQQEFEEFTEEELVSGTPEVGIFFNSALGGLRLESPDRESKAELQVSNEGITLTLRDTNGFKTSLGTTALLSKQTGLTHKTSAASLVMFDKDGKIIWQAP